MQKVILNRIKLCRHCTLVCVAACSCLIIACKGLKGVNTVLGTKCWILLPCEPVVFLLQKALEEQEEHSLVASNELTSKYTHKKTKNPDLHHQHRKSLPLLKISNKKIGYQFLNSQFLWKKNSWKSWKNVNWNSGKKFLNKKFRAEKF